MNNKGISLIALIITIVVMLIISAVVIKFIGEDNSVISKSERAKYQNSITQIEELLNEIYVENYNEIEEENLKEFDEETPTTKARALAYFLDKSNQLGADNNIFVPSCVKGNYTYHKFKYDKFAYVSNDGKIFYFLSPANLKKYDSKLTLMDLEEPSERTGNKDVDYLYGVTADLNVFVILDSLDNLIGASMDDLSSYDFNSVIFKYGSYWTKIFNVTSDVTYQEGQSKNTLTIDSNNMGIDENFNFSGIGELQHLTKLYVIDSHSNKIDGIADASESLTYLWIENPSIQDYSGLSKLKNLSQLYLCNVSGEQFKKIMQELSKAKIPLQYLGILHSNDLNKRVNYRRYINDFSYYAYDSYSTGNSANSLTDEYFNYISLMHSGTKSSIKYMYVIGLNITTLNPLNDFNNLIAIRADANRIKTLAGLSNKPNLSTIRFNSNCLENLDISGVNNLTYLDVRNNSPTLNRIQGIKNMPSLSRLWFKSDASTSDSCVNLSIQDIIDNRKKLNSLSELYIDPKYAFYLIDSDNTSLTKMEIANQTIDEEVFLAYSNLKNLTKISIDNITIKFKSNSEFLAKVNNNSKYSGLSQADKEAVATSMLFNSVFSNFTNVTNLQILNMNNKLQTTEFLTKMTKIIELDFRNNQAVDLENLCVDNKVSIKKLSINNKNINLSSSKMQKVINNLSATGSRYYTYGQGLIICDKDLFKKLENCDQITTLYLDRDWRYQIGYYGSGINLDLSKCKSLNYMKVYNYDLSSIKFPENITNIEYGQVGESSVKLDLSNCKKLSLLYFNGSTHPNIVKSAITTLQSGGKSKSTLNKIAFYNCTGGNSESSYSYFSGFSDYPNLTEINFNAQAGGYINYSKINCIDGIDQIKSLKRLYINFGSIVTLPDFSNLENLEYLKISNMWVNDTTYLDTINVESKLGKLTKLKTLDLSNNHLVNLIGLIPMDKNDFSSLVELDLSNNDLKDEFINGIKYNVVTDVLVPLYNVKLRKLYLAGNDIDDCSELKKLSFTSKNGF